MISTDKVTGRWKNSKSTTTGISEFNLADNNGILQLTLQGVDGGFLPKQVGPLTVSAHSADENSKDCTAFHTTAHVNGKDYSFAGNVNKGLIIIATYVKNRSDEAKNIFVREFFYKLK